MWGGATPGCHEQVLWVVGQWGGGLPLGAMNKFFGRWGNGGGRGGGVSPLGALLCRFLCSSAPHFNLYASPTSLVSPARPYLLCVCLPHLSALPPHPPPPPTHPCLHRPQASQAPTATSATLPPAVPHQQQPAPVPAPQPLQPQHQVAPRVSPMPPAVACPPLLPATPPPSQQGQQKQQQHVAVAAAAARQSPTTPFKDAQTVAAVVGGAGHAVPPHLLAQRQHVREIAARLLANDAIVDLVVVELQAMGLL